jgi:peroxiredoxin
MKLNERLAKLYDADGDSIEKEILQVLKDFTNRLKSVEKKVIQPGSKAPAFRLVNAMGFMVSLEDLLRQGSVVISFYRGSWCPYCNEEIKALQENLPQIREQGANLVAISPELPDNSLSLVEKMSLEFEVLSDRHNMVARQYGIVFELSREIKKIYIEYFDLDLASINGDGRWELPIPATFIVDRHGTVVGVFADSDYTKRMEPDSIIEALTSLRARSKE